DCSDPRVIDFYNLVVDAPAGRTGAAGRVVPPGPVVDVWTPGEPEQGNLYVLLLTGANLGGSTVSSSDPRVRVFDVENSDEEVLTGLLEVEPGAPIGTIDLLIDGRPTGHGQVPKTTVSLEIKAPGGASKQSVDMRRNPNRKAGEIDPGGPGLFLQEGFSRQKIEAAPEAAFGFCLSLYRYRRRQRQKVLAFDPTTQQLVRGVLDGLEVGDRIPLRLEVYSLFMELEFEISFGCHWDTHGYACITATIGFEVLGRYGQVASFRGCVIGGFGGGFSFIQATTGGIFGSASFFTSTGGGGGGGSGTYPCLEVAQQNPFPIGGAFNGEIEVTDCCDGETPIFANASGSTFGGWPFGGELNLSQDTVATAETTCLPTITDQELTVVAYIDEPKARQDLQPLRDKANLNLRLSTSNFASCGGLMIKYLNGFPEFLETDDDRRYINAWLTANSANDRPADQIDSDDVLDEGDYRAFARLRYRLIGGSNSSATSVSSADTVLGDTPDPCGTFIKAAPEAHPANGTLGRYGLNRTYLLTQGRLGRKGQAIDTAINDCPTNIFGRCQDFSARIGQTTPWIWALPEIDHQGQLDPDPIRRQIYPTYLIYRDGQLVDEHLQVNPQEFIDLDADNSSPTLPQ
ncbi:MAG: hypothetical protein AAF604_07930, partial [Acidobacteriota bacterium]